VDGKTAPKPLERVAYPRIRAGTQIDNNTILANSTAIAFVLGVAQQNHVARRERGRLALRNRYRKSTRLEAREIHEMTVRTHANVCETTDQKKSTKK
jgi:hypothetical protein